MEAMENGPGLKMYVLLEMVIFQPAMLVYQSLHTRFSLNLHIYISESIRGKFLGEENHSPMCAMVKSRYIGDGHPTFNRNLYNGYINTYYWVDDHPLLYGNNGSLDPSTCFSEIHCLTKYMVEFCMLLATLHSMYSCLTTG